MPNGEKTSFIDDIEYLVFDRRKEQETEFREYYSKEINDILGHINNIRVVQRFFYLSEPETTESIFEEISLINRAIEFVSSSLILVSHGSVLEALALLRIALESSCSATLIHFDEKARDYYLNKEIKKFKSSNAIGYAKKKVKYVGRLYGILSKSAVHVNAYSFGPKSVKSDKDKKSTFNIEPFYLEETLADKRAFVLLIYLVTFIVERNNEIITLEGQDNTAMIGDRKYEFISCSNSSIDKIFKEFYNLVLR